MLKAGRELSEPPQSFFLVAKKLTQQAHKGEKSSINDIAGIIFQLVHAIECEFVKLLPIFH